MFVNGGQIVFPENPSKIDSVHKTSPWLMGKVDVVKHS